MRQAFRRLQLGPRLRAGLKGAAWGCSVNVLMFPLLSIPLVHLSAWSVLDALGYPSEPPWPWIAVEFVLVCITVALTFAAIDGRLPPVLNRQRLRFGLAIYLIAVYGVGLYVIAESQRPLVLELSELSLDAATQAVVLEGSQRWGPAITFYVVTPLIVLVGVALTGVWRTWLFWRDPENEPTITVLATIGTLVFLTEAFAVYTALGEVHPYHAVEYYLWHLAEAVPILEIPETLRWSVPLDFDSTAAGVRLLLYKVLVIVPLLALARAWLKRSKERRGTIAS